MDLNIKVARKCCAVMAYTLVDFRPIYHQAISDINENGIRQALWAKRADMLTNSFLPDERIKVLHIKRGVNWQIDPVADLDNGDLYILINKKNLDQRIRDVHTQGWSTHYLYSALLKNSFIKTECFEPISLFPLNPSEKNEHKKWREEDCEKILGNLYEKIHRIIVIAVEYEGNIAATAHAIVYDSHYNVVEDVDISDLLLPTTYEDINVISLEDKSTENQPLVKLKHNKKIQKKDNK